MSSRSWCWRTRSCSRFGSDLAGKTIALWGLAFKPNTDDMREAPSRTIVTEWKEFRTPDFEAIKAALRTPVVFDGRNLYEPAVMAELGIEYYCIGRAGTVPDKR
jgi:UDPglucose 6-dehydrogenase